MDALAGPFLVACALLLVAGCFKIVRPGPTSNALRAVRLPSARVAVRVLGMAEVALGIAAAVTGAAGLAALVAVAYLAFGAFIALAMRAGSPIQSCGCFGAAESPPSIVHVLGDLALFAVAAAAAVGGLDPLPDILRRQDAAGVPLLLLVAIGSYLTALVLTELPKALALGREPG